MGVAAMVAEQDGIAARLGRWLGLAPPFGAVTLGWLIWALALGSALSAASRGHFRGPQAYFLLNEDLPAFVAAAGIAIGLGWAARRLAGRPQLLRAPHGPALPLALGAGCGVIGVIGYYLVFQGYLLSLDEFLADFDARIFARGALMAPVAPPWRSFVPALQPIYMAPTPSHDIWASAYLPVHAALRALARTLGAGPLLNPLLSAFAVVAVWGVARRLWPERPGLALGAAALLASSSQFLVTAMTAYAMPAHLAFNLAWLWLFLRGGRLGHGAAIVLGFFAAGLHQLLFHPIYAAPFVLQLWLDRRWRLAGVYTLAYAAICGFWIEFPLLELRWAGEATTVSVSSGGDRFLERVLALVANVTPSNLSAMVTSLVRFAAWQSPFTAPLAAVGAVAAFGAKGHMRAMLLGVVLTLLATALVVPSQTHGWGYRYLHGLLGSISLVAVWAWARLIDPLANPQRAAANGAFAVGCALSLLVLAPLHAWQAWTYVRPYAAANALVQAAPEAIVIIDNNRPWFDMGVVVRNDPFLTAGPKVMLLDALDEAQVRALCLSGPVGLLDGPQAAALGVDTFDGPPDPNAQRLRRLMAQLDCARPLR
jgi:hypothetical protein